MEKCVAVQLNQYLNDNCLSEEFQSAYKIAHCTETALLKVQSDILMSLDNGKAVHGLGILGYFCGVTFNPLTPLSVK